jgi:hypothetical protein
VTEHACDICGDARSVVAADRAKAPDLAAWIKFLCQRCASRFASSDARAA